MADQGVAIGVIATPAVAAQDVADRMVAAGITQHPQLRAQRARGARRGRRTQGRPVDRAADPRLPRAAQVPPGDRSTRSALPPLRSPAHTLRGPRMSVLVVGISHKTAPVALLERLALDADGATQAGPRRRASDHVTEAPCIATCNRLEIYAEVDRFHGSVEEVSRLIVDRAGEADRVAGAAPLRPLRRRCRLPPLPRRRRPRLDGRGRGPDPRPDPRRAARRPGARHPRAGPQPAVPAGVARRQAHPRRDRHRRRRALARHRGPRPRDG